MEDRNGFWMPEGCNAIPNRRFQDDVREFSINQCKQYRTCLDVGAHIGSWSVDFEKKFNRVVAFEPVPEHRECYARNVPNKEGNVEMKPFGLGDAEKTVFMDIYEKGNTGTMSVLEGPDVDPWPEAVEVNIRTLDSFNIPLVDYIKVDIEGYEMQFLDGAEKTLLENKPLLCIEIKDTCSRFGYSPKGIKARIESMGFELIGQFGGDYVYQWKIPRGIVGANG